MGTKFQSRTSVSGSTSKELRSPHSIPTTSKTELTETSTTLLGSIGLDRTQGKPEDRQANTTSLSRDSRAETKIGETVRQTPLS